MTVVRQNILSSVVLKNGKLSNENVCQHQKYHSQKLIAQPSYKLQKMYLKCADYLTAGSPSSSKCHIVRTLNE